MANLRTPSPGASQDPLFIPDPTPSRPERLRSPGSSAQRNKLLALDDGVCLITGDKAAKGAIQDAHIVSRQFPVDKIEYYERLWGLPSKKFNVDSRFNRVHLRSDIHHAYDSHLWALVPTQAILNEIVAFCVGLINARGRHRIYDACLSILPNDVEKRYPYVFVPIQVSKMAPRIMRTEPDDSWNTYHTPFKLFPLLQHHSHPYYTILNAYLKFQDVEDQDILAEHRALRDQVNLIHAMWCTLDPRTVAPQTISEDGGDDGQGFGGDNNGGTGDGGGDGGGINGEGSGQDEARAHSGQHGLEGGGREDVLMDVAASLTRPCRVAHDSDLPPTTAGLVRKSTSSTSLSGLPELDDSINPGDSASVASEPSTGLRSDDEGEAQDRHDEHDVHPAHRWNVDAWRKGVLDYL
ncbi:hypothetical protein FIBSPDRAFT_1050987 [Athelia psychrophila]|uniref:HNH nuclease domain-containing protein n=1 Tax=Athelia psychrophila TaxID=1759441 RepID=A0A165ZXW8_9AGAM|nr:hypothetical protein FIBSPDRAFT_1055237 [Fibularhizoctonia sp. CBS 109695]KZP11043.1 hypothetical protein FIBSPDRAFT_1050987 [Fibularhizoctonia sp. CBS 109695]